MPDLPPVEQQWQADTAPYVDALTAAIAAAQVFVEENQKAIASVAALQAALNALHGKDVHIGVDAAAATAAAAATRDLAAASGEAATAEAAESGALASMAVALDVVKRDMADASADLMMQTALLREMRDAWLTTGVAAAAGADTVAASTVTAGDSAGRAAISFRGWWSALNLVRGANISLFGGIIGTVSGFHLLADAVAEVIAVTVPAAIALGAFGVAAAPAVQDIVHQMQSLYTVTTATGQAIYPLSGVFQQVANAVRPEVYQLFGDAIRIVNRNTGEFQTLATGAGSVLDQLAGRFTVAATSGHGFQIFLANAVTDLAKLGDIVGNLGGALGHVFAAVPGYAQTLLNLADAGSKVIEWAAGVTQPLLKAGLAAHGAFLYLGLGVTATAGLLRGGLTLLGTWGERAAMAAADSALLGGALSRAAPAMFGFAAASAEAAALPWGWILAAAAALGFLVYKVVTAKDATQQFVATLESAAGAEPAVRGINMLMLDQAVISARLSAATASMRQNYFGLAGAGTALTKSQSAQIAAYQQSAIAAHDYRAALTLMGDQSNLVRYRVEVLGHALGGTGLAMGMLAASGVKLSQMLSFGKNALAQVEAQVLATAAAYRAMGQTGGMLGADMNVMNVLASDQYNAVSKLNQAWGAWVQTITGGMSSLSQFETALSNMKADAAATSAGLSGSISSIKSGVGGMTYTLKGFGPAAQQSWQQFTSAVNQGNAVIAQMRTYMALGAVSNQAYTSTIKALVGQMIPFTQGSKAALTMLENLAVQAGGPATNSLKALQQWAGVSGKAARDQLAKGLEAATIAGGQLSQVAQHLSSVLGSQLSAMVSQAAIKASGLQTAMNNLTTAMQHGGSMSNMFHGNLVPVIGDLLKLHQDVPTITAFLQVMGVHISAAGVAAIIASAHLGSLGNSAQAAGGKMSAAAAQAHNLGSAISSLHSRTITVTTVFSYTGHLPGGGTIAYPVRAAQHGGIIPGFQPGVDSVPAMLSPGEAVLNPYATRALGPGLINWLNTAAERGGANPAALRTGGLPLRGGGAGPNPPVSVHLYLDSKEIFAGVKVQAAQYATRVSGRRTGLLIPGTTPQV